MAHAPTAVAPERLRLPALGFVLAVALGVRLWIVATHTYIVWPDETFQYLEPAHRLAFGSGVITWEFLDGIRSWFLPGILAGIMRLTALVDPNPDGYVLTSRVLCVLASLAVPFVGFRIAERRAGPAAALLAGLLCALATETVYFAPVVMTEPLATDAALLAIWLGDGAPCRRRLLGAGLLFGLAASLRYQYAPILAVVALAQHARRPRDLLVVAAAGLAVVVPVLGLLDWITWGVPFQSVWLNFLRNATQGVSAAMGAEGWYFYPAYYLVAWGPLAGALLICAVLGAVRAPLLGLAVVATIALHSLAPHKELRFVFLATACMPTLIGIGLATLLRRLRRLPRLRTPGLALPMAALLALAVSGYTALAGYGRATPPDAWHRDRSMLQATAAARAVPGACGLAIRTIWVYRSGGYSYWHRDLPIYFETWDAAQVLDTTSFRLNLASELDGRPVRQFPAAELPSHAGAFNVIVGAPDDALPGFAQHACFGEATKADPRYCVFVRPGGCE